MTLDTDTVLRARLDGRTRMLRLDRTGYFKVAKDRARPFVWRPATTGHRHRHRLHRADGRQGVEVTWSRAACG